MVLFPARKAFDATIAWIPAVVGSVGIAVSTFVFVYAVPYLYVVAYPAYGDGGRPAPAQLEMVTALVGSWGARLCFFAFTLVAAVRVSRHQRNASAVRGITLGLIAAVLLQVAVLTLYSHATLTATFVYLALGAAGGYLGALYARSAVASREALYRASALIGDAHSPADVALALGETLGEILGGHQRVTVTLWQVRQPSLDHGGSSGWPSGSLELWASWTPSGDQRQGDSTWTEGDELRATFSGAQQLARVIEQRRAASLPLSDLPAEAKAQLLRHRYRGMIAVPLLAPGDKLVGLLVVAHQKRRRLSRNVVHEVTTAAAQAALALEYLRLIEEQAEMATFDERQRISREIHDTLTQGFAGIRMHLGAALEEDDPRQFASGRKARRQVELAERLARENLDVARDLVWELRPGPLERHPLGEALQRLGDDWSDRTGVEVRLLVTGEPTDLTQEAQSGFYRVAQQALANVEKHARANAVTITLSYLGDLVVLDVLDDGQGFETCRLTHGANGGQRPGGVGLVSMRERVERLGGRLVVESEPGRGTAVAVELPITRPGGQNERAPAVTEAHTRTEDRRREKEPE